MKGFTEQELLAAKFRKQQKELEKRNDLSSSSSRPDNNYNNNKNNNLRTERRSRSRSPVYRERERERERERAPRREYVDRRYRRDRSEERRDYKHNAERDRPSYSPYRGNADQESLREPPRQAAQPSPERRYRSPTRSRSRSRSPSPYISKYPPPDPYSVYNDYRDGFKGDRNTRGRQTISESRDRNRRKRSRSNDSREREEADSGVRDVKWMHDRHASVDEPRYVLPLLVFNIYSSLSYLILFVSSLSLYSLIQPPSSYRPPSPTWVSRAGGVAIMKKR